jgi:hypothetical protein
MPSAPVYFVLFQIKEGGIVRHEIRESFEVGKDIFPDGSGGWEIRKISPSNQGGSEREILGKGQAISVAITDWLRSLCGSFSYEPAYKKKKC